MSSVRLAMMSPYYDVDKVHALQNETLGTEHVVWARAFGLPQCVPGSFTDTTVRCFCLMPVARGQGSGGERVMTLKFYPELVLFTGQRAWDIPELQYFTVSCQWPHYLRIRRRLKSLVVPPGVNKFELASELALINWNWSESERTATLVARV